MIRDIFSVRSNGAGRRRLTQTRRSEQAPEWSTKGRLVFMKSVGGDTEIFVMKSDGSRVRRLTHNDVPDRNPDWSPNGRWIVYERDGRIVRMRVRGSRVVDTGVSGTQPTWSANGQRIAYLSAGIRTMKLDGSGDRLVADETILPDGGSFLGHLDWQPVRPPS
jgi:Tol biopolymer transport system component